MHIFYKPYTARFILLVFAAALVLASLANPAQAGSSSIVISEIQTGTPAGATQEFVELYNPTDSDVPIEGWTAEYRAATSANWTKRAELTGSIKAHSFYLIAPIEYITQADADWSTVLAASAGNVRLKDREGNVIDQVGYGSGTNAPEASPTPAPAVGQSIERLPGHLDETGGNGTDTDNNAADFAVRQQPDPQDSSSPPENPSSVPEDDSSSPGAVDPIPRDNPAPGPADSSNIDISELLVDPQTPLTDAHDEFIELHNTGSAAADLSGFTLKTGSNFHDSFKLKDTIVQPGAYIALYSAETGLSLTNSGGAAQLLDASGDVISQTANYPEASPGQSWALFGDQWQWTLQTTPGQTNILATPVLGATATAKSAAKKTAAKPKAKAASKAAKKSAAAKPKATKVKAATTKTPTKAPPQLQMAVWLIAVLIGLTISYAIYEFRYDIQNFYYRLRGNQKSRKGDRPAA